MGLQAAAAPFTIEAIAGVKSSKKRIGTQISEATMGKVSATELARNTREILDRVVGPGETIAVERNHTLIAQILPVGRTMTGNQAFAGLRPMLTSIQGARWLSASKDDLDDTVRDR